jgi:hypothetical protein
MKLRTALVIIVVLTSNLIFGCGTKKQTNITEVVKPSFSFEEVEKVTRNELKERYVDTGSDFENADKYMGNASGYMLMYVFSTDNEICSLCQSDIFKMTEMLLFESEMAAQGNINLWLFGVESDADNTMNFLTKIFVKIFYDQNVSPESIPQYLQKVNLLIIYDEETLSMMIEDKMEPPIMAVVEMESESIVHGSFGGRGSWSEFDSIIQRYEKKHLKITE